MAGCCSACWGETAAESSDKVGVTRRVHVGDMANLVYSSAIDSESTVTAPVKLEDHALIGAAAVAMPGTTLGKGATLGAMAASLPGAQLPGEAAAVILGPARLGCPPAVWYSQRKTSCLVLLTPYRSV